MNLNFKKMVAGELVNEVPPGKMNTFSAIGDIDNDGLLDFVLSGRDGTLAWFENSASDTQWKQHIIDKVEAIECGGLCYDLDGDGYIDIIIGGDSRSDEIMWYRNPGLRGDKWEKRIIAKTGFTKIHDAIIADVTGDGVLSLVFTNQKAPGGTNIMIVPLPEDPLASPWPNLRTIASGKSEPNPYRNEQQPEEGLAVGDLDGDGKNELVCGTHWYKYDGTQWNGYKYAAGYMTTKCVVTDIDGDGRNEILLAEGDACIYGKTSGANCGWFKPNDSIYGMWEEHVVEENLLDPHSLEVGDICGNGKPDIFLGEIGVADGNRNYAGRAPMLMVYENDGHANFIKHVIDVGTGTHNAFLADIRNRGVLDIIGKPLHDRERWNFHVWFNGRK